MSIPPALTLKTITNAIPRPEWWINFNTTPPLEFASLNSWGGTVGELIDKMFDPTVTFEDLKWIRSEWPGKLVIKGVQSVEDAVALTKYGVDGIVLSNHGGRQLDAGQSTIKPLTELAKKFGHRTTVMIDSGLRSGPDVACAIASGAKFAFMGRSWMYGVAALGKDGGDHTMTMLKRQFKQVMEQVGCERVTDLPKHLVASEG
jgi:L-lactate dehydrogenase (cytochrome)